MNLRRVFGLTNTELDRLNPPPLRVKYDRATDTDFIELLDDPQWTPVGYIPTPQTRLGWFVYHVIHGLAMRYPLHKVFLFAAANTDNGRLRIKSEIESQRICQKTE